MSEMILKDIWDLRGELDSAVNLGKYEKITDVKNKFNKMVQQIYPRNILFRNFQQKTMNPDTDKVAINLNRLLILENIQAYEKKYIQGQSCSTRLKKTYYQTSNCYAINIWVLRALYDKFIAFDPTTANDEQIKQNMILGKTLIDKIKSYELSALHDWEREALAHIESEIVQAYISFCNNNNLNFLHSAPRNEFVEDQETTEDL